MSRFAWVDPRIHSVRVAGVRAYLEGRGWQVRPGPESELLVFDGPTDDDGEPIVEVVPASEQMRDFLPCVEELIAALSILENRGAPEVLTDILAEADAAPSASGAEKNGGTVDKEQASAKRES
jgi:hypothetical protein